MQELIPITLFICIAYAIHAIADARARSSWWRHTCRRK